MAYLNFKSLFVKLKMQILFLLSPVANNGYLIETAIEITQSNYEILILLMFSNV